MQFKKMIFIFMSSIVIFLSIRYFITRDIWDAVRKNRVNYVLNYINRGGNVNLTRNNQWMEGPNEQNFTLLMEAARQGKPEAVKVLLEKGADVNATTSLGRTALLFAAENGNLESVEALVRNRADINFKHYISSSAGDDILGIAIFHAHIPIVDFLINQGVKVKEFHLELANSLLKHSSNQSSLISIIALLQKQLP